MHHRTVLSRWVMGAVVAAHLCAAATAQTNIDPMDSLSMHLRTLASEPRDLNALLGAGKAALDVGDPNAALGFFARAQEVDPASGRAKAGLAHALVDLEQPDEALKLFAAAQRAGVAEQEIAGHRGLAHDLQGDGRKAQRDYALALKGGADDEITRRWALSLGIAGDRAQALALLDPLLRRRDQAAWRAKAFIEAMNGDLPGAEKIARTVLPVGSGGAMSPFLGRLAGLGAADRAHAVNFGTIPSAGTRFAAAVPVVQPIPASVAPRRVDDALIPVGQPFGRRPAVASAQPPTVPRRQVVTLLHALAPAAPQTPIVSLPARPQMQGTQAVPNTDQQPLFETGPAQPAPRLVQPAPTRPVIHRPEFVQPLAVRPTPAPVAPSVQRRANRLADIIAGIQIESEAAPAGLPSAAETRAAKRAAQRKAADAAAAAAAEKEAKAKKAAEALAIKKNPARIWVQVATGNNERGLPTTWRRIRDDNAEVLKAQGAWSVPYKATNRLLAGPFKSTADARATINRLAKGGVQATLFNSDAGLHVTKLPPK